MIASASNLQPLQCTRIKIHESESNFELENVKNITERRGEKRLYDDGCW